MRGVIEAGVPVAAVVSTTAPHADAGPPLPDAAVTVLAEVADAPREIPSADPNPMNERIAAHVAALVPEGARVQVGPGQLGAAMLSALRVRVHVDSGLLPDAVVDLDRRGLLLGTPIATYLAGTARLHEWAHRRPVLHPIEVTHDLGRLSNGPPLVALNTAVEIDTAGQVNAEGTARAVVGGVGGHPDYSAAAARSRNGLSVVAVASEHGGRSTLVTTLSRPVTTPAHDVDVVVTERGAADLRGLGRAERARKLVELWDGRVRETSPPSQIRSSAGLSF
jgi:acyl-CoA hydrolase